MLTLSIYTKTGDKGGTGLLDGTRVSKSDVRLEAYGTVDEVVSFLALARAFVLQEETADILGKIERELFVLSSELANPKGDVGLKNKICKEHIDWLEDKIDIISEKINLGRDFIVPGPYKSSAILHVVRTVTRRAERQVVKLNLENPIRNEILVYLNRLSDLLFILAKYEEEEAAIKKAMEKIKAEFGYEKKDCQQITLEMAEVMINAAKQKAEEINVPMVISIVDSGGHLIALERMNGALLASIEISMNKAYTSVAFKMPTSNLDIMARPDGELYGINTLNDGKYVTFGGGFPIFNTDNKIIGAIGVSGGNVKEDMMVAKAGLEMVIEGS